jgi:ethanolamine utilization protein EutS
MEKERKIFESVPGKQVTLAHIIANPDERILQKVGLQGETFQAIGLMTITPSEVAIIAVDYAKKAAQVKIGFIDRFSGSVFILGDVSSVETALVESTSFLKQQLGFSVANITRT